MAIKINQLKSKENKCYNCDHCCTYVCTDIDTPKNDEEYDEIIWYILHKKVYVYIDQEDNSWNLVFESECGELKDGHCLNYEGRPTICRTHSAKECEKHTGSAEKYTFRTPNDLLSYLKEKKIPYNGKYKEKKQK